VSLLNQCENIYSNSKSKLQDYGQDEVIYFAATYEGHSLEELHRKYKEKKRSFPISLICQFAYKAIQLIRNFHEAGLVHRDVHPGNFLLKDEVGFF